MKYGQKSTFAGRVSRLQHLHARFSNSRQMFARRSEERNAIVTMLTPKRGRQSFSRWIVTLSVCRGEIRGRVDVEELLVFFFQEFFIGF